MPRSRHCATRDLRFARAARVSFIVRANPQVTMGVAVHFSPAADEDLSMIRVLLAEDQAMVRGALSALLKLESDLDVIGTAADGEDAWSQIARDIPDVVVTDIEMPRLTGLELAQRIRDRGIECKIVILTTFARPGFLRRALDAGVSGYLLKDAPA